MNIHKIKYKIFNQSTQKQINNILNQKFDKDYQKDWIKQIFDNTINHYVFNNNYSPLKINDIINITNNIINNILPLNYIIAIQPNTNNKYNHMIFNTDPLPSISVISSDIPNTEITTDNIPAIIKHNIPNFELEILYATANELSSQIINNIINHLTDLAKQNITTTINTNNFEHDKQTILTELLKQSNNIAKETLRGSANTILTNPLSLSLIQLHFPEFKPNHNSPNSSIFFAGTLHNFNIICYQFWNSDHQFPFLLSYKGNNFIKDVDAGTFLIPNLLVNTEKTHLNSKFKLINNNTNGKDIAPHYYRFVNINLI